jgi:hypothetical protein
MRKNRGKHSFSLSLIDYLYFLMSCLSILFVLQLIQIVKKMEGNIQEKAEYIIETTWDDNSESDVDTWIADPLGNIVWFKDKKKGFMALDQDDMGTKTNYVTMADGSIKTVAYRKEVVTIRSLVPGRYTVNVHLYTKKRDVNNVKVVIRKLNPYSVVYEKQVTLTENKQEETIVSFDIDENGFPRNLDTTKDSLIGRKATQ